METGGEAVGGTQVLVGGAGGDGEPVETVVRGDESVGYAAGDHDADGLEEGEEGEHDASILRCVSVHLTIWQTFLHLVETLS